MFVINQEGIGIYEKNKTCCFIGHRKVNKTDRLIEDLRIVILDLILNKNVCNFLFGSRSEFDDLCLEAVSELKKEYLHIRRIYVRAEYPYIDDDYKAYLLERYEYTYYPEGMKNSGRASYIERNYEMINKSDFCICYYDENYKPPHRQNSRNDIFDYQSQSGTKIAYDYAIKKCKRIINVFSLFQ